MIRYYVDTKVKTNEPQEYDDIVFNSANNTSASVVYTLNHQKIGTVHYLRNFPIVKMTQNTELFVGQFRATATFNEGDTFIMIDSNNGTTEVKMTAEPIGADTQMPDEAFVSGDLVSVTIDGINKKLGFKIGGSGVNQTLPPQVRSFAVTSGNAQNKLSWLLPVDTSAYEGLVIVKKVGSAPTKLSDGTKISLSKTATSYTDTELTNDTKYYYRAFPYNAKKQYQTDIIGAVAYGTPKAIDPVFANNSWEVIDSVSRSGDIPSTWKVGDTKDITLTTGETFTIQIYGFKHDDLADGSGKAGITLGIKNLIGILKRMNAADTNGGSFTGSELYNWLQNDLFNNLPYDLKPHVKTVNKKTSAGLESPNINTNSMKIFLFSEVEVFGEIKYSYQGEGLKYDIFTDNNSRIKGQTWWLRSPMRSVSGIIHNQNFCRVNKAGDYNVAQASLLADICFGFCI